MAAKITCINSSISNMVLQPTMRRRNTLKIIVFGLGKFYKNRKEQLRSYSEVELVAYTDNNIFLWGELIDGTAVVPPEKILEIDYDVILIMSTYEEEIYQQLIKMGVGDSKIKFWEIFLAEQVSGMSKFFRGKGNNNRTKDKVLIISTDINYDGGSLAAIYAALALNSRGYDACLAAPAGDDRLIAETTDRGISIYIRPSLPFVYYETELWIKQFDMVIVNVFQMMQSAIKACLFRPTLWWIHEPMALFGKIYAQHWNRVCTEVLDNIGIYAVSRIPRNNFNHFYPKRIRQILNYGIPDMLTDDLKFDCTKKKMVFAIIGSVSKRKAQDVFCKAVKSMNQDGQTEFWIIGNYGKDVYSEEIRRMSAEAGNIKMLGLLTREEIYSIFPQIDVVVCTSREDPLPIVMTEGMMFGKVCITTDTAGTADYIQEGENGFVIPSEDADALRERMEWVLNSKDKLEKIGRNARKTYEEYFTMEVFGENLEKALIETNKQWHI